jgi:3-hydroxypropanoate dehydrogenase
MTAASDDLVLDTVFRTARTANAFVDRVPADVQLIAVFDLLRMGPTSANTQPGRFVFLKSREARERLIPALAPGNVDKTRRAPMTVIVAHDLRFHELIPRVFPHFPRMQDMFTGDDKRALREVTALRNGSLQGAYFIVAARLLGLDCGPMSGFDNARVDAEFFPDGRFKSNFLINLGYADAAAAMPRSPRLDFGDACRIL